MNEGRTQLKEEEEEETTIPLSFVLLLLFVSGTAGRIGGREEGI